MRLILYICPNHRFLAMESSNLDHFTKKTWTAGGIILFLVIAVGLFFYTFNLWLLLMAGVVLAVYLRLIANKIKKWTGWKDMVCFVISVLFTLLLLGGLSYLIGNRLQDQYQQLEDRWPTMKKKAAEYIKDYPILEKAAGRILGQDSVDKFTDSMNGSTTASASTEQNRQNTAGAETSNSGEQKPVSKQNVADHGQKKGELSGKTSGSGGQQSQGLSDKLTSTVTGFFQSTFGLLGDLYVVLFLDCFWPLIRQSTATEFRGWCRDAARKRPAISSTKPGKILVNGLKA